MEINYLTSGDCFYIFKNINATRFSDNEKIYAIKKVLSIKTKNQITKVDMYEAMLWLLKRLDDKNDR